MDKDLLSGSLHPVGLSEVSSDFLARQQIQRWFYIQLVSHPWALNRYW